MKSELSMKEEAFQALDGPKVEVEKATFSCESSDDKKNKKPV